MIDSVDVATIVQGGAVAIALFLIWCMDKRDRRNQETMQKKDDQLTNIVTNHISSSTKASEDQTESNYKLRIAVEQMITLLTKVNGKK